MDCFLSVIAYFAKKSIAKNGIASIILEVFAILIEVENGGPHPSFSTLTARFFVRRCYAIKMLAYSLILQKPVWFSR